MEGRLKKVESFSSNNYTSRKVSTELCPEFFPRSIWWCNFLFPLYASSELTNNIIICFDFWSWTRNTHSMRLYYLWPTGQFWFRAKNFRRNERHHQKSDWFHPQYTYMIWDFPFICMNQIIPISYNTNILINEIGPLFLKWKGKVYWGQNWQNQTLCCESKQARQI